MTIEEQVQAHIAAVFRAEAEHLEAACVEAMALQDFDRLDRLTVIHRDGVPAPLARCCADAGEAAPKDDLSTP